MSAATEIRRVEESGRGSLRTRFRPDRRLGPYPLPTLTNAPTDPIILRMPYLYIRYALTQGWKLGHRLPRP